MFFFFSSRRRHTRWPRDWSSDVCSSDLDEPLVVLFDHEAGRESDQRGVVGEDADDVGAPADLPVEPLERIGIRYERADAWLTDRRVAGRLRASGTGTLGATQDGQAGLAGWAESPR